MKGETTIDERVTRQLQRLEDVRKFYSQRFTYLDKTDWEADLISCLISDATYLACYYGIDLETTIKESVDTIRFHYPDIP